MENLSDDERRQVLGEVLADELKVIREYVSDIPAIKQDITKIKKRLDKIDSRLDMHEVDIRYLRSKFA